MVIDCDVNGTKLAVRAAWNHQHNAFKSQNVFIFFFFRNSLTTWDFLQSHRMFFVQKTLIVVVVLMPFGRKKSHVIGSIGKHAVLSHVCIVSEYFWIMLFITTLFQSYALLDIINFLFILHAFETKLNFTTTHHP